MKVWNQNDTNLNLEEILFKTNSCCFIDTLIVAIFVACNFIVFILLYSYFVRVLLYFLYYSTAKIQVL